MGLIEAILEGSSLVREVREKAREEGREEGFKEGFEEARIAQCQRVLRLVLKANFPGLEAMPEIETITSPDVLESLLEIAASWTERAVVERSIAAVARPN